MLRFDGCDDGVCDDDGCDDDDDDVCDDDGYDEDGCDVDGCNDNGRDDVLVELEVKLSRGIGGHPINFRATRIT